jgi:hypothetical protein
MGRRSSKSKSGDLGKTDVATTNGKPSAESKSIVISSPGASLWRRALRRRLPWLLLIAGVIGLSGVFIEQYQKAHRPGEVVYSSDDPNAQVILEKDGEDIPLKKGTSYKSELRPGQYKIRLEEGSPDNLKLHAHYLNLDPGGRGFIKVTREEKAAKP